jgi:hypothetical protein
MSKSGSDTHNCLWFSNMERQASRETALNMLMMSRRRRAFVDESEFKHGSRSAILEQLGMLIPNFLGGCMCLAASCAKIVMARAAVVRRVRAGFCRGLQGLCEGQGISCN